MIILDSSATLPLVLEDEPEPRVDLLFDRFGKEDVVVPQLWGYELANSLTNARKSKRLTEDQLVMAFAFLDRLPFEEDEEPVSPLRLSQVARQYDLTAYDAAYLELAIRKGVELATLDQRLAKAAQKAGVRLAI